MRSVGSSQVNWCSLFFLFWLFRSSFFFYLFLYAVVRIFCAFPLCIFSRQPNGQGQQPGWSSGAWEMRERARNSCSTRLLPSIPVSVLFSPIYSVASSVHPFTFSLYATTRSYLLQPLGVACWRRCSFPSEWNGKHSIPSWQALGWPVNSVRFPSTANLFVYLRLFFFKFDSWPFGGFCASHSRVENNFSLTFILGLYGALVYFRPGFWTHKNREPIEKGSIKRRIGRLGNR